jgi:hypothetical protein
VLLRDHLALAGGRRGLSAAGAGVLLIEHRPVLVSVVRLTLKVTLGTLFDAASHEGGARVGPTSRALPVALASLGHSHLGQIGPIVRALNARESVPESNYARPELNAAKASRRGGCPNMRAYSRLNCDALS